MTNWYAVYTRPRYEKKVADIFSKRKIENYCPPVNKVERQWIGNKNGFTPLFTSNVFVRIQESQLADVKKLDGIINLVYWMDKPVIIRDIEIDMLKRFLSVYKNVQLEKTSVNATDMVKLINGTILELDGNIVSVSSGQIKLLLPSLGYIIVANASNEYMEIVSNKHIIQRNQVLTQGS
jgi:transcription antitermination factor NusG